MEEDQRYLQLLSEQYPSIEAICTEITRLNAQLSLPKGTEHFMSDIHGEYEAFCHIMNNCSGVIREKVHLWLGNKMTQAEADELCTLIYYPEEMIRRRHEKDEATPAWYREQVENMVHLARMLSSKYTRDKVRSLMAGEWEFLLDELIHYQNEESESFSEQEDNRRRYHDAIIAGLIGTGSCDALLTAMAALIKNLAVDRLHVVGDIFDRGPGADKVMDILMKHHSVDIEWGNHDVLWMGAAAGSECCIAGVLRNSLAYKNTEILERGYGIPLRPLALYAEKKFPELSLETAMLQAVNQILFKVEGQLINRNPEFEMEDRLLLEHIDQKRRTVRVGETDWPLKDVPLPEQNREDPYALTGEEKVILADMRQAFTHSIRLREQVSFLYRRGSLYKVYNGNLLFHGCIPLNEDGSFLEKQFGGTKRSGRAFMDYCDKVARRAFYEGDREALDFMWYLWCGTDSPVCGRQIKTFARTYIADERAWEEPRNPYYTWYNREETCRRILAEFGLDGNESHIINGHTPIRVTHGESPLKAGGKLIVIDGGFCRAYQKTTGIAGYTLIANSHGMRLMSHQPFTSLKDARETGADIHSQSFAFDTYARRRFVHDTDHGRQMKERREDLMSLLAACRSGQVHLKP